MNVVLATGLLYSFQQADLQGKVIVMILMVGSALTWSVMLTKWQQLRRARQSGDDFLAHFRRERDPLHLYINDFEMAECPLYNIYRMGAEEISTQCGQGPRGGRVSGGLKTFRNGGRRGGGGTATLTVVETDAEVGAEDPLVVNLSTLRGALGRAIDQEVMRFESQIAILSTAVTGGPFLGLLGSAWGVMSVFAQMGIYGTVRLGAVAPGISAALLATVVGLLVAVPSLFAYNYMAHRIRHATMELEGFADEFVGSIEHNYVTN